ncbi:MAG: NAD(P)H-dependent oxidoreductase [Verrucomicrobia bacterium]|nr:NAD(P)H-dependent oxidoreductase [Verrucomicrobiota bacterium]
MYKWICLFLLFCVQGFAEQTKVLLFAGSTRTESLNKKLINEAATIVTSLGAEATVVDLRDYPIPFYDGDLEEKSGMPEHAKKLRSLMMQSDVVVISTPEYNGSIPGLLKNALDWMSRKETGGSSREAYLGKKFILLNASAGGNGGKRALSHLKMVIEAISKSQTVELSAPPTGSSALKELLIEGLKK